MFQNFLKEIKSLAVPHKNFIIPEVILLKANVIQDLKLLIHTKNFANLLIIGDINVKDIINSATSELQVNKEVYVFEHRAKAHQENISAVESVVKAKKIDVIIAIGSGSISDIAKVVAKSSGIPYIMYVTAPSVNGFTSITASVENNGRKASEVATMPLAVYADENIIYGCSERLVLAGISDLLAMYTARVDWFCACLIDKKPFDNHFYDILEYYGRKLINHFLDNEEINDEICKLSFEGLILSGLMMSYYANSAPASGSEHIFAHFLDLKYYKKTHQLYHGELISMTVPYVIEYQIDVITDIVQGASFIRFEKELALKSIICNKFFDPKYKDIINHKVEEYMDLFIEKDLRSIIVDNAEMIVEMMSYHIKLLKVFEKIKYDQLESVFDLSHSDIHEMFEFIPFTRDRKTLIDLKILSNNNVLTNISKICNF